MFNTGTFLSQSHLTLDFKSKKKKVCTIALHKMSEDQTRLSNNFWRGLEERNSLLEQTKG